MATDQQPPEAADVQPQPFLLTGFGLLGAAFVWNGLAPAALPELRSAAIALGLLVIGFILWRLVPRLLEQEDARWAAAGLWGLGALACVVACHGLGPDWDSLALLYAILGGASAAAALLTLVTPWWRYTLIGLLIVAHFSGVFCAITVVPPSGGETPFLSAQAYVSWFHNYLIAVNMNNGYHFYAPEPGPCALAWFRVEWEDGSSRWVRIPDHEKMRNHLERRRHGALATVLSQTEPLPPFPPDLPDALTDRRVQEGLRHKPPIPLAAGASPSAQYRQPSATGRLLLSSYARFVARDTAHPDGADAPVAGVKIYMVEYYNPPVEHFQAGRPPLDPGLYHVYFMGDFSPAGELRSPAGIKFGPNGEPERDKDGRLVVLQDPYLYWRLPIAPAADVLRELPKPGTTPDLPRRGGPKWEEPEGRFVNFAKVHAGDKDEESIP